MNKKTLFIFILFLFSSKLFSQEIRIEILDLVQKIESNNILKSKHTGASGQISVQYLYFDTLSKTANINELLLLLKHPNAVVKGYSSWALSQKKYPKLFEIFEEFLNTNEIVKSLHGCYVSESKLNELFYEYLYYDMLYSCNSLIDSIFYLNQLQKMDSILIENRISVLNIDPDTMFVDHLTYFVLGNNNANPKTYDQIKKFSTIYKVSPVLKALAEYRNSNDIPFLLQQGKESFYAISVFPDPAFWDLLIPYQSSELSIPYFSAIASYKNIDAINILNELYLKCDDISQISDLDQILIKQYCSIYQDLILKIWEDYNIIDLKTTERLIIDNPIKSSLSFSKGLLKKQINYSKIDYSHIITPMLYHIAKFNNEQIVPICINNILQANSSCLLEFLNYVNKYKLIECKDVILQRLKEKNFAYDMFNLTETILSFDDSQINNQLKQVLISNQKDWDSENWSYSFRKLLRQHGIKIEKLK